jgi:hypothetical protein
VGVVAIVARLIFFCSALPSHIARPKRHRSSRFSRPAFFCPSFSWHCFRQIPASCNFASSPFAVPPLHHHRIPSHKAPLALEAEALTFGCPRKPGQKKETFSCPTSMFSGMPFGVIRSPTSAPLKHAWGSLATPGTEACDAVGGALRPKWREWPARHIRRVLS